MVGEWDWGVSEEGRFRVELGSCVECEVRWTRVSGGLIQGEFGPSIEYLFGFT